MKEAYIKFQHGNKYTKAWIGHCTYEDGGGFSLSAPYNGGRFTSKKSIERYINETLPIELEVRGYKVKSVTFKEGGERENI